jgi:hypothetical protein
MDRYWLLVILNLPFIIFGVARALKMFRMGTTTLPGLISRLVFWSLITASLIFAQNIYKDFYNRGWVDSPVISMTTIILTTGIIFSLFLVLRLYSKLDALERRQAELLSKLSIINSVEVNKTNKG